ncbi:MAG: dTDP-4-dehydrorhamnose 3,5-epimerase [Proteobacteria bacterium]|nr:MAG: dTDP-4-dehydrorhamnose 3,5-epimerase [Pseudomonadota bacterium]
MPFNFSATEIDGPILVTPRVFNDSRGHFFESYKRSEFVSGGIADAFVQTNASSSARNVVRGLHYQLPPHGQAKLVRCVRGAIFDVAVDIRRRSATFGRWVAQELSEENRAMLYVPEGFAHGFLALSDGAEVNYMVSAEYHPESERGVAWDDPVIAIDWPVDQPLLSEKDRVFPRLADADVFE